MRQMYLVLGDWSNDGHGRTEKILLECNRSVKEIQKAYKASCRLTGISFNHNDDFTECKNPILIATEYESGLDISDSAIETMWRYDIDWEDPYERFDSDDDKTVFAMMWLEFVKLSLPRLEAKIIEDDIPCVNGYWNDLNVQFGYGLYL